jgi:putative ABC transport system substrate-binding protein
VTGISSYAAGLNTKRLEFLHQIAPRAVRLALLWQDTTAGAADEIAEVERAAAFGLTTQSVHIRVPADVELALEGLERRGGADALMVIGDALTMSGFVFGTAITFAHRQLLPTACTRRTEVAAGGLLSYGAHARDLHERTAWYVDRLLRGSAPDTLPVEQPTRFELVLKRRTAQFLGLDPPRELLAQVTEAID